MLRYILLKLPSFTSKTDFSVSSPCNKTSILRPSSPIKREYRREPKRSDEVIKPTRKRSYSFPTTRARGSHLFDTESRHGKWDEHDVEDNQGHGSQRSEVHESTKHSNKSLRKPKPDNIRQREDCSINEDRRVEGNNLTTYKKSNKPEDFSYPFKAKERYELEAARPRRNRSQHTFDVFDDVTKNGNDPVRYLQPNKLRPFGSTDNIFLPFMMAVKTAELDIIPQSMTTHSPKSPGTIKKEDPDDIQRRSFSTLNKENKNKHSTEEIQSTSDISDKHKDINQLCMSHTLSPDDSKDVTHVKGSLDNYKKRSSNNLMACNKTLKETLICKADKQTTEDRFQSYRLSWNEPKINIEPSPFLQSDDRNISHLSSDLSRKSKKTPSDTTPLKAPWPAYSERVRNRNQQNRPSESVLVKENLRTNVLLRQKRSISTENFKQNEAVMESRNICEQGENIAGDFSGGITLSSENQPQLDENLEFDQLYEETEQLANNSSSNLSHKKLLSSEYVNPQMSIHKSSRRCRSSTAISNSKIESPNLITLCSKDSNINIKKNFARSSKCSTPRPYEPESCGNKETPKKYFLPSKVRLKPPECIQKPFYRGCITEDPCPPRADRYLQIIPKKLPILKTNKCPCVEPYVPTKDPKLRRLKFKFEDPPREECPCDPCPCPPRADDFVTPKPKKLSPYVPGHCACVEPPPMIDVPLVKLKKICEPEEKCYPPKPCIKEEPCRRADADCVECSKKLPILKASNCPCVEPYVPNVNPQLRRLKMEFKDPEKIYSCEPKVPCPPRADDFIKPKPKRLPIYKPGHCQCVEPPPMIDVPLKRLKKMCTEPDMCDPPKSCPVETCEDRPRADDTLKIKHKKLPILEVSNCKCIEPEIPDKNPKLRRLKMKFSDTPRTPPCEPEYTCPPRADDTLIAKPRKLLPYVPGYCKCVEPPPLIDVPLIPLKKICEPEDKCYPRLPCPKESPCEDNPRADDNLRIPPKKLPILEAKDCPCVENAKLKDAPKLKRLALYVPEPLKVCAVSDPCTRADDNLKDKVRKLPLLQPGACPCIDPKPPEDIKPLKRLKCKEEEPELVHEDPCVPFPRADWGCWEYTQSVEPDTEKGKKRKKGTINYNNKRKFNTDSRANLLRTFNDFYSSKEKPDSINITVNQREKLKANPSNDCKFKSEARAENDYTKGTTSLPEKIYQLFVRKSKSLPTLRLLKQLNKLEINPNLDDKESVETNGVRIMDIKSVLNKISTRVNMNDQPFLNTNIRKLCTNAARQAENAKRPVSTANILFSSAQNDSKDCFNQKQATSKKDDSCPKSPCPKMVLKGCAQKSPKGCEKERPLMYCDKKPSPYPAFSEAMDEEIQPYSKTTQWTCNNKQYGFHPNSKKFDKPLDSVKDKKKFSTSVTQSEVNYFKALQDGVTSRPKTSHGTRGLNTTSSISVRKITKQGNGSKLNTDGIRRGQNNLYPISYSTSTTEARIDQSTFKKGGNYTPYEEKRFLNKKGRNNTTQCNSGFMSKRGYSTMQENNSNVPYPLTTETIPQHNLLLKNTSSATTNTSKTAVTSEFHNQILRGESNLGNNNNIDNDKSACKKKQCAQFRLEKCPTKVRQSCKIHPIICQKSNDPYHVQSQQDKLDIQLEEDYISDKLCMKNEGLTEDFCNIGQFITPMRSINYVCETYVSCTNIEQLKKSIKRFPKHTKRFCTKTTSYFDIQKRKFSTSPKIYYISSCMLDGNKNDLTKSKLYRSDMFEYNPTVTICDKQQAKSESLKLKRMYIRNYNILVNPENKVTEHSNKDYKPLDNTFEDSSESCKCVKLRNTQWRINNYQKWCRLNKLSNLSHPVKRLHLCSRIKYRRYAKWSNSKKFSTSTAKCTVNEYSDLHTQRGISTTMILAKTDCDNEISIGERKHSKVSVTSKDHRTAKKCPKFKLANCPPCARTTCEKERVERPCTKLATPNPAFSECSHEEIVQPMTECPLEKERIQHLQPQYPLLPEIGTISLPPPPHQGKIDRSLEDDYIRLRLGIKKEGLTQDCETFGQPVKALKCKDYTNYEYMGRGKASQCLMGLKRTESNTQRNPCKAPKQPCPSRPNKSEESVWERIVNYFKARPNCPPPDEWKKRALREKAEKAARAAGLCLCEPKDLPKTICVEDLPKVITPKACPEERDEEDCDEEGTSTRTKENRRASACSPRNKRAKWCGSKRCLCTTPRRCYSSNVDWENLEEINKKIEEEEKKKLDKKCTRSFNDEIKLLIDTNNNDDCVCHNPDSSYEDIFSEAILNKNEENDIIKYLDVDNKDSSVNYDFQIVPNEHNFVEIISNEPAEEMTNYSQVRALAGFQDYFNNIDMFSNVGYEDVETAKTNNLLKELDKLLEDNEKSNKEK